MTARAAAVKRAAAVEIAPPEAPRFALAWTVLVYAICTAALAYPILGGRFLVNPHSDEYIAGYAFREFGASSFRQAGHVPLWNPYLFGGMPFVAAMHGDIFYPTFLLRWVLPTDIAMTWGLLISRPWPYKRAILIAASFASVDSKLLRAAASLGQSPLQSFRRVVLPLSKAGLVTGFALSFAHTLGEFGVVLMIGGNIPGVTRTISIDIYDQAQAGNYPAANYTALVLLLISFVVLSFVYGLNRRALAVGPWK